MNERFLENVLERRSETQNLSQVKRPKKYKVILLNDDYTPMEFVVLVLKRFFHLSEETATKVMMQVHVLGKGVCGIFTRDIAETKEGLVNDFARAHEYPLLCITEPE